MFPQTQSSRSDYLKLFLNLNAWFSTLALILIFVFLLRESFVALTEIRLSFLMDKSWYPLEGQYNLLPMLAGSLLITFCALLMSFPLGLFGALFAHFYCPQAFKKVFLRVVEVYNGIPSVIFGFWGLMKVVPLVNEIHPPGQSLLAGALVLAFMIFPIMTLNLISGFEAQQKSFVRISESLGLSKSTFIWQILLPQMKGLMLSSSILAAGRAIGETMVVLMVCGNIVQFPQSLLDPVRTLTANIALEMAYAMGVHRSSLFLSGLLLLLVVGALFLSSEILKKRWAWKG